MLHEDSASPGRLRTAPDFFDLAEDMRKVFDDCFRDLRALHPARFVWDYWHVPDHFTYFRTFAERYFPSSLYGKFAQRLRAWGFEELGCASFTPIWLSYYVDGCAQELHVDAAHGPWSFVYSLTRWEGRCFTGGETILCKPAADPQTIPARFNQLIAFDPRIPHGVTRVKGTQDPREARLVLHGWFNEPTLRCEGGLSLGSCQREIDRAWPEIQRALGPFGDLEGLAVFRVMLAPGGTVEALRVIGDLPTPVDGPLGSRTALESVGRVLRTLTFADVLERAQFTLPMRLPLPRESVPKARL